MRGRRGDLEDRGRSVRRKTLQKRGGAEHKQPILGACHFLWGVVGWRRMCWGTKNSAPVLLGYEALCLHFVGV